MKINKLKALIIKDIKMMVTNKQYLIILSLPLVFGVLYRFVFDLGSPLLVLLMTTDLGLMMIGANTVSASIAEEKEKNTLRSLSLAGVTGMEFLISKLIVVFMIGLAEMGIIFVLSDAPLNILGVYSLFVILTLLGVLLVSAQLGIYAKDTKSVGYLGVPYMLLLMLSMIGAISGEGLLYEITKYLPLGPISNYISSLAFPEINFSIPVGISITVVWIIIGYVSFIYTYKKKGIDN